jgi:hypothetical protein
MILQSFPFTVLHNLKDVTSSPPLPTLRCTFRSTLKGDMPHSPCSSLKTEGQIRLLALPQRSGLRSIRTQVSSLFETAPSV